MTEKESLVVHDGGAGLLFRALTVWESTVWSNRLGGSLGDCVGRNTDDNPRVQC